MILMIILILLNENSLAKVEIETRKKRESFYKLSRSKKKKMPRKSFILFWH